MSFLPAVQREIASRQANDPVRITLDFLLQNAVGRRNPVSLNTIVQHLQSQGLSITPTGFQQSVLAQSRSRDYFIGSGGKGYFLIDTPEDAAQMRDFYQRRIQAEQSNLNNLMRQASALGWTI